MIRLEIYIGQFLFKRSRKDIEDKMSMINIIIGTFILYSFLFYDKSARMREYVFIRFFHYRSLKNTIRFLFYNLLLRLNNNEKK